MEYKGRRRRFEEEELGELLVMLKCELRILQFSNLESKISILVNTIVLQGRFNTPNELDFGSTLTELRFLKYRFMTCQDNDVGLYCDVK